MAPWRWIYKWDCSGGTVQSGGNTIYLADAGGYTTSDTSLRAQATRINGDLTGTSSIWYLPKNANYVFEIVTSGGAFSTIKKYTLSGAASGYTNGEFATAYRYDTNRLFICSANYLYDCSVNGTTATVTNATPSGVNKVNLLGSMMFTMQGHKFLVRSNSGTEGKSDFGVYDVTNGFPGTAVQTFTPFSGTCTTYGINMWVNIKKVSATETTIVIYYRGLGVAKYTMKPKCSKPTANVNGGTYTSHQHITLSCATSGATIRYTTNGTEPTSSSTAYSSAINVTSNTRIRAKAFKSGFEASDEFDQTYTINATLAAPTFSVASGTQFSSSGSVTITAPSGSTLHYSTDGGSTYTTASGNTATVTITQATTLKAYATQTDKTDSSIATASYTVKCATPTANINGGTYATHQRITLSCATSGATIRYTTDGSEPTSSSAAYSSTITLTETTRLRAKAFKSNCVTSDEFDQTYNIDATLAAPTFSPASGTQFTGTGSVTITAPSGSTLHYSTDGGSSYTTASSNTATVTITEATTLKAYATQTDKTDSSIAEASYTVKCPTPSISPSTGTYPKAQSVTISCADAGATIYYTTDGSTPTTSSTAYSGTFTVSSTTTVKAIAVMSGCVNSDVASETITIKPQSAPATNIGISYSPVIGVSTNNPSGDLARIDATITFDRPVTSDGGTFPVYPSQFSDYYLDHYIVTVFSGSGYAKTESGANFLNVNIDAKTGAGAANTVTLKARDMKVGQNTEVYVTAHYIYSPSSTASQSAQASNTAAGYTYATYAPSITATTYAEPHQAHDIWWGSQQSGEKHTCYFDVYRVEITIDDNPLYNPSTSIPVSYYQLKVSKNNGSTWENVTDRTVDMVAYGDDSNTYPIGQGIGAGRFKGNYRFSSNKIASPSGSGQISLWYYYAYDVTSAYSPTSVTDPSQGNPAAWLYRIEAVYGGSESVNVSGTAVTPTNVNITSSEYADYMPSDTNPVITGVDNVGNDIDGVKEVQYYDLKGVRLLEAPATGIYIEVRLMNNGQVVTSKRLAR